MPVIQGYDQQYLPQGQLNVQATPDQMGAGVGQAMQQLGDTILQAETQRELTDLYVDMSDVRRSLSTDLDNEIKSATPGDPTMTDRFNQIIDNTFQKLSDKYTTPGAKREFERMSAAIRTDFILSSIKSQSDLAALGIKTAGEKIMQNYGSVVYQRPEMLASVLKEALEQIDNPQSIYRFLNKPQKDELKAGIQNQLREAAQTGQIVKDPQGWLSRFSPDALQQFNMLNRIPGQGSTKTPKVNSAVAALSQFVKSSASKYGVDENIMLAQIQAESGGDATRASKKGARGVSQFMPDTAKQYGVDVTDNQSSIEGQGKYMSYLLKLFGGDYQKALAGYNWGEGNVMNAISKFGAMWINYAPKETREYVSKIMLNAGVDALSGQPLLVDANPVKIGDPDFDGLPWETQYKLTNRAQQEMQAQEVDKQKEFVESNRLRRQAIELEQNNILSRLIDNDQTLTAKSITSNDILDFEAKTRMLSALQAKTAKLDDTDPVKFNGLLKDIISGKLTDPNMLWDYAGNGVSLSDTKKLIELTNGKGTLLREASDNFFRMARKNIVKNENSMLGVPDPDGEANYYNFWMRVQGIIAEKQKQGVPAGEIAKIFDPVQGNKEYVGLLIPAYVKSTQEIIKEKSARILNDAVVIPLNDARPRKPGETPEQYDQRMRGGENKK